MQHHYKKNIFFFRHGETDWNVERRIKGQLEDINTVFTDNGIKQIENLAISFKERNIEIIFASDLERSKSSAISANRKLNLPISFHKELRGLNFGRYQGCLLNDFINQKDVIEAFNDYNRPIPEGESINQLNNRLITFLEKIVCEVPYKNIAIVTHRVAMGNLRAAVSGDNYVSIDSCVLSYLNNTFKVVEYKIRL